MGYPFSFYGGIKQSILNTTTFADVDVDQCLNLPESMNGNQFPNGCPGAVNIQGEPIEEYCKGYDWNGNVAYPWWQDCCQWDNSKCVPKGNIIYHCTAG